MIKAVISDADGTLVNTLYLIRHGQYEAAVEYLVGQGLNRHELPDYEEYETYLNQVVGGPTFDTFERTLRMLAQDYQGIDLSRIDCFEIDKQLKIIQDRLAPLYVHPFTGLDDLLKTFDMLDMKFAIYTSGASHMIVRNFGVSIPALGYGDLYRDANSTDAEKLNAFTERMKMIYGLPEFTVVTCDDVSAYKPDPEGVLVALDRLGVRAEEAVVLGDHSYDIQAAKRAGTYAIGMTHGFGSAEELKEAGADALCSNLHEVAYHLQYVL